MSRASSQSTTNSSPPSRATVLPSPAAGAEPLGDFDEQRVADVVAQAVVDVLEAVEVEQQHADDRAPALGPADRLVEAVDEELAASRAR